MGKRGEDFKTQTVYITKKLGATFWAMMGMKSITLFFPFTNSYAYPIFVYIFSSFF